MPSSGLLLILLLGVIAIALGARLLSAATRQGYVLCLVSIAVYAFLYVPLAIVVIFSFNDSKLNAEWVGFTLSWYRTLFNDQDMLRAAGNSLLIAIVASMCATIIILSAASRTGTSRNTPAATPRSTCRRSSSAFRC